MPRYATDWVFVAGRRVKVATGGKTQTINICTPAGVDGQYECTIVLEPPFIQARSLEQLGLPTVADLVSHLRDHHQGKVRGTVTGGTNPAGPAKRVMADDEQQQPDTNSKRTRVEPLFGWLLQHGGQDWAAVLVSLAEGLAHAPDVGSVKRVQYDPELVVQPSPTRLSWMIQNAAHLIPQDGRDWRELNQRVFEHPERQQVLQELAQGRTSGVPQKLVLETGTHCDCFIECDNAVVWVEGKRNDWLSPGIKWDSARDQLARNLEAAWQTAQELGKQYYCLLLCYETQLKYHEQLLVDGYRSRSWSGGWPHLDPRQRGEFASRIGLLRWRTIAAHWSPLRDLPALRDLDSD